MPLILMAQCGVCSLLHLALRLHHRQEATQPARRQGRRLYQSLFCACILCLCCPLTPVQLACVVRAAVKAMCTALFPLAMIVRYGGKSIHDMLSWTQVHSTMHAPPLGLTHRRSSSNELPCLVRNFGTFFALCHNMTTIANWLIDAPLPAFEVQARGTHAVATQGISGVVVAGRGSSGVVARTVPGSIAPVNRRAVEWYVQMCFAERCMATWQMSVSAAHASC